MRRITRRLDGNRTAIETRRQYAFVLKLIERPVEKRCVTGVNAQGTHQIWKAPPLAQPRRRVTCGEHVQIRHILLPLIKKR
jgi:hypothetical protein